VLDYSGGKREGAGALLVLPAVPPPVPPWLRVLRWVLVLICIAVGCIFAMLCGSIVALFLRPE
jgi:hypothetical protein